MTGNYLNKLLSLEAKHALYREDGKWYHNLKYFPGVLFDKNGYVMFNNRKAYLDNTFLQRKRDLHISGGIQTLPEYITYSRFERLLIEGISKQSIIENTTGEEIVRVLREINAILRKQSLVDRLKRIYDNTCQICGTKLQIGQKLFYSEVHHIIPLGRPHNGRDVLENMICVCPNHHVQLDLGAVSLDVESLIKVSHVISTESLNYHNSILKVQNNP